MITLLEDVADFGGGAPFTFRHVQKSAWSQATCYLPFQQHIILRHLIDAGNWVSTDDLLGVLVGDREDGGGISGHNHVNVLIYELRKKLRPGFRIESELGRSPRGYRFVIEQEALERTALKSIADALAA